MLKYVHIAKRNITAEIAENAEVNNEALCALGVLSGEFLHSVHE
jgi:hypothetical protein